jgi:Raf kinase inhibitor-like YbhB/YbcL family protein
MRPRGEIFMSLTLTSPAFERGGEIPMRFTCEGEDISPALAWSGAPAGAASLALIFDDPDDTPTTWAHWVLYNIPATVTGLAEGVAPADLPPGTLQGLNDWKATGYRGSCPPAGRHGYVFKLYALDTVLPDLHQPATAQLEAAMDGHILARAELIGTYQKRL